jgi:ferric iron reductase protein FhuF
MLERSPIEEALAEVERTIPEWRVTIGEPGNTPGWILGTDLMRGHDGPFVSLLEQIAHHLHTKDKRTVAASFALRFGWCASIAIPPYLIAGCVPNIRLSNLALKFRENTLFEGAALLSARGTVLPSRFQRVAHPHVSFEADPDALLRLLRLELQQQAQPVIEALHQWSGFARRGSWGMVTSGWASRFVEVCEYRRNQEEALPLLNAFFVGEDEVARMQPRLHKLTLRGETRLYQRRASCCRYYLLPEGDLCASCPLVSDEDRLKRNRDWTLSQLRPE